MNLIATIVRMSLIVWIGAAAGMPGTAPAAPAAGSLLLVAKQGKVEVLPPGTARTNWVGCETNQLLGPQWRLRTRENSRATLQWPDLSVVTYDELAEVEILPPASPNGSGLRLIRGVLSFLHKDEPGDIRITTRGANAGIKGTEFVMAVETLNGHERTVLSVIDGIVSLTNEFGALVLTNGQQAVVDLGEAPALTTAGFVANHLLQWAFYYPAVLDLQDLPLLPDAEPALTASLAAYRSGDLPTALERYPADRPPASDAERLYQAALFLSVGQVQKTEAALAAVSAGERTGRSARIATALRRLIAAVKHQAPPIGPSPELPTEWLAASYEAQSRATGDSSLRTALALARRAAEASPRFSFAWARVAELEFSFGHTTAAMEALGKSLALADRNAQALALQGFLQAARQRTGEALASFERALAVDPALGNAWLGRGLIRIRRGDERGGRADLMVAAAAEPQRASLRSTLGKALAQGGDLPRAQHELDLARRLDPADPTPWLYSALLNEQANRINEGIRDLERSVELNDNRRLYRSRERLDEDRAVRQANLARLYREAGLVDWSVWEAAKAVSDDYANYSAHLFLANSYNELRDPNLLNLRYETPALAEYLLANLLAPVGAGILSPTISQQEYSKLLENGRLGLVSTTEYLSRGAWTESGAQYGTLGTFSYALDGYYRWDPGQRVNDAVEQRLLSLQFKQQLTPQDTVHFQVTDFQAEGGDLAQYFDPASAATDFRFEEKQEPRLSLGYHHEWNPGSHTLFLAARLDDTYSFTNPFQPALIVFRPDGDLMSVQGVTFHEDYESHAEIYSTELQQIWQGAAHSTVAGMRAQFGHFETRNRQEQPSAHGSQFTDPAVNQDLNSPFRRLALYGYHEWQVADSLQLIGGLTCDWITYPENFRTAPLSREENTIASLLPKAGVIWSPGREATVRFAYTRSLAGASLEQSYQLEPSQVAGFVQSFRSLMPESVAGANAGAQFETFGLAFEQKLATRTYWGVSGEILNSVVRRRTGAFLSDGAVLDNAAPFGLQEHLDYQERSVIFSVSQLVGEEWSFGVRYRLSDADLKDDFVEVPDGLDFQNFQPRQHLESVLHQLAFSARYNHRCGLFAEGEALWFHQSNMNYSPDRPGETFWYFNAVAGYRFPRRKAELALALLNLTSQNYRLNPLNTYNDVPRERTLALRLQLSF